MARVQDGILLGGAAALATFGTFSLVQAGPAIRAGRRPDPQDYPDYAVWRSDEDAWEDRLAGADLRDERIWTGVTLYTGAALLGVLVPLTGQETRLAAAHPGLAWPDLRARLGPGAVVVEGALP